MDIFHVHSSWLVIDYSCPTKLWRLWMLHSK